MLDRATILYDDGGLQLACADDVFVERWLCEGTIQQLTRLRDDHLAFLRRRAGRWSTHFVEVSMPVLKPMGEAERAVLREREQAAAPRVACTAIVLGSAGFVSSIIRTAVSAATLAKRPDAPYKIFSAVDAALVWVAATRPHEPAARVTASELAAWYRELEGRLTKPARPRSS